MEKQNNAREISRRGFLKSGLAGAIGMPLFLKNLKANEIIYRQGKLKFYNAIADIGDWWFLDLVHRDGALEGKEGCDSPYDMPFNKPNTKIVSILQETTQKYELDLDSRPTESFSAVNLELSVDTGGGSIDISCANNLWCSIDPTNKGYDFGEKPITIWRRFPAEPDKLQFLADIREAYAKNNFIGPFGFKYTSVPLNFMDRTYENQAPYDFLQVRFDVYPGDLDLNGVVDMKGLNYIGKDWKKQGQPLEFVGDITGPLGLPDGKVDGLDLERYVRDYLKDIRDIMPGV